MTAMPQEAPRVLSRGAVRPRAGASRRTQQQPAQVILLRPVARMRTRTFFILIAVILTASLLAILALNTVLAKGSFARYSLMQDNNRLTVAEQNLAGQVAAYESPVELERRAREMGMIPAANPVYVDTTTGKILGDPTASAAPVAEAPGDSNGYINPLDGTGAKVSASAGPSPSTSASPRANPSPGAADGTSANGGADSQADTSGAGGEVAIGRQSGAGR